MLRAALREQEFAAVSFLARDRIESSGMLKFDKSIRNVFLTFATGVAGFQAFQCVHSTYAGQQLKIPSHLQSTYGTIHGERMLAKRPMLPAWLPAPLRARHRASSTGNRPLVSPAAT